jgi:hypothetical protein
MRIGMEGWNEKSLQIFDYFSCCFLSFFYRILLGAGKDRFKDPRFPGRDRRKDLSHFLRPDHQAASSHPFVFCLYLSMLWID